MIRIKRVLLPTDFSEQPLPFEQENQFVESGFSRGIGMEQAVLRLLIGETRLNFWKRKSFG